MKTETQGRWSPDNRGGDVRLGCESRDAKGLLKLPEDERGQDGSYPDIRGRAALQRCRFYTSSLHTHEGVSFSYSELLHLCHVVTAALGN